MTRAPSIPVHGWYNFLKAAIRSPHCTNAAAILMQDYANVDQAEQDRILAEARQVLAPWQQKLVWLRMRTTQAVRYIQEPLDYVYVDARHDYCGTLEDIIAWWPLIRSGEHGYSS
jgi:hypothetical protein